VVQAWSKLAEKKRERKKGGGGGERKKKKSRRTKKRNGHSSIFSARGAIHAAAQITCMIEKRISTALGYAREEDPDIQKRYRYRSTLKIPTETRDANPRIADCPITSARARARARYSRTQQEIGERNIRCTKRK